MTRRRQDRPSRWARTKSLSETAIPRFAAGPQLEEHVGCQIADLLTSEVTKMLQCAFTCTMASVGS